jgi:hypothetical protein
MSNIHGVASNSADSLAALRSQLAALGKTDFNRGKDSQSTTTTQASTSSASLTAANGVTVQQAPLSPSLMNFLMQLQSEEGGTTPIATTTASSTSATGATATPASSDGSQDPIQQLFDKIDTSGDGEISKSEMEAFFKANGGTATQADTAFTALDPSGASGISESQFASGLLGSSQASLTAVGPIGSGANTQSLESLLQQEAASSGTSSSVTGSNGSTTTTVTYADGTKIELITPASTNSSSSSSTTTNPNTQENSLAALIQEQAQELLQNNATGQSS